jgi:MYXO-CTERM domain-containing protein
VLASWGARLSIVACLAAGLSLVGTSAEGSVIKRYDAAALYAGADLVVEGQVTQVQSRWNANRTGLVTVVQVSVAATPKGQPIQTVEILQPGGQLDGVQEIIAGMPTFVVGQEARFHLASGTASYYRVLGWQQGVWPVVAGARTKTYRPPSITAESDDQFVHFAHNGLVWPDDQIPVPYKIHGAGSADIALVEAKAAIFASFEAWQEVPCSRLRYSYEGNTTLGVAVDDTNVVLWIEDDWIYGAEAAAATAIGILPGMTPTVDVAFNGVNYTWAIGPVSTGTAVQDVQGVLTHELGHFSGLTHTTSSLDTMYISWIPWKSQRPLSADDKQGLCDLYPQNADECINSNQCEEGALCETYALGTLCSPQPDPIGESCDYNQIDCEDFCLFTVADLSAGYCSQFCETDDDCPDRFACKPASAGSMDVQVCFSDDTRRIDAGPLVETCASVMECASGQYCDSAGSCTRDCAEDRDCEGNSKVCNGVGQCVTDTGGCGCTAGSNPRTQALWLLLLTGLVGLLFRKRIRR